MFVVYFLFLKKLSMKQIVFTIGMLVTLTACTQPSGQNNSNASASSSSAVSALSASGAASFSSIDESAYMPLSDVEKQMVESHLGTNIATYAAVPGVLGGTFYMTRIDWYTDNTAIVEYEDGHIQGKARATATMEGGKVKIVQFIEFFSE